MGVVELITGFEEWLVASCAAQGVPVLVEDRAVLAVVVTLTGRGGAPVGAAPARRRGAGVRSGSPDRADAIEVKSVALASGGADLDSLQERTDDRGLAP